MNSIVRFGSKLTSQCAKLNGKNSFAPIVSTIHTTSCRREIFKIQDENDYKEKVLKSDKLVILDFYATWCGPCRQLAPRLETLIGTKGNKVDLAKVDVDELDTLAAEYKVSTIPSIFAIKNGKVVDQFVGSRDDDQLDTFIENALGK